MTLSKSKMSLKGRFHMIRNAKILHSLFSLFKSLTCKDLQIAQLPLSVVRDIPFLKTSYS